PDLVCVGGRGWLNDHVYAALDRDPELAEKVRIISGLTDSHLALLYSTCLFTVYLSTYEGWGLPVTESLCYGKVPLLSDTSSLPE
ncbi:glycosyltransferase, partial [Enterococcus faecium]